MAKIHYFPRYSQKENMVTNNTLLLFSRLYNNSPEKFRRFLDTIFEDNGIQIDTTITFKQQEKYKKSIPDGIIEQESFKVIIETKLYSQQNLNQIESHWQAFDKEDKQIFLWLDKEPITDSYRKDINDSLIKFNTENGTNIDFVSTTFKKICSSFNDILEDYDLEMRNLIDDYESFCEESDLIDNISSKIRVVLAGKTFYDNCTSNIYYHPSERGYRKTKYIGLYKNKAVRAIGELICSVDASYNEGTDTINLISTQYGKISNDMINSLKKVIREAKEKYGYNISEGHRFFFVDQFINTGYNKISKGGIMGTRYINLEDIEEYNESITIDIIADLLRSNQWDIL